MRRRLTYRWNVAPVQPVLAPMLARDLNLSPLLVHCLLNRGYGEPDPIRRFLQPRLQDLADPMLLPQMAEAVTRLCSARQRAERVVLFGDYDVDGVTATTLLYEVLAALGWQVDYYLPHRMEEGYGLSQAGVENCLKKFPTAVLLAVDCGSTAVESVQWLKNRGVDVVVLDHHQVSDPPPAAVALVNPRLRGEEGAPFQELCSVGLAFKMAHALVKRGREEGWPAAASLDVREWLDLVALGTVADIVPVIGENRILLSAGIRRLNATRRPGLLALIRTAGIEGKIGSYQIGFQLAPRLNAAGRLETADDALRLLRARDEAEATPLARALDLRNRERQKIERSIADDVIGAIRARFDPSCDCALVEGQMLWHLGVVGIVASRVLHEFYRPTIILGGDGNVWRGSGRSIEGFDLAAALRSCDDLLLKHGGHAMAAGLTIHPDKIEEFRVRLNGLARSGLRPEQLQPSLRLDGDVELSELTLDRLRELDSLQHTGPGNPPVQVAVRGVTHARPVQRVGAERQHAKLWVTDGHQTFPAMIWNSAEGSLPVGCFDLAVAPQLNDFNGSVTVQLKVLDWRPAARTE